MNTIYSIKSSPNSNQIILDPVWTQNAETGMVKGYTAMIPIPIGESVVLFAYNKTTQKTDTYALSSGMPWVQQVKSGVELSGGPWDILSTFVLGNNPYLMTYRKDTGAFGFYHIANDLSISTPYLPKSPRATPTMGFTTVVPFTSHDQQYFLGYDFDTGTVAISSLVVKTSSRWGIPLFAQNVWYHKWSNGWTHFAFFKFGDSNFFFKINMANPNVNIDHIHDDPTRGAIEVIRHLERVKNQISERDALLISIVANVPWENDEPYLLTHTATSGSTAVYRIHADCRGWTKLCDSVTQKDVSMVVPYRIGDNTYALFYKG